MITSQTTTQKTVQSKASTKAEASITANVSTKAEASTTAEAPTTAEASTTANVSTEAAPTQVEKRVDLQQESGLQADDQQNASPGCACRYKETERSTQLQADVQKRLNRAIGQLNGVKNMIDDNRYCGDVLTQLAAAESAVHSAAELILRNHLETCVKDHIRRGDDAILDEAMRLIKKFARS